MESIKIFTNKGQGLIEALVALGAGVIVISTIAIAVITAVNNSDFSKNQDLAKTYAEQGLEIIRGIARNNWNEAVAGNYCLAKDSTILESGNTCSENVDNFVRSVKIANSDDPQDCQGGRKVTVSVNWLDGRCKDANKPYCHSATVESCIFNIQSVPMP